MIDIQVSGTIATIPEGYFKYRLEQVADLLWDSVKDNFLQGGRPEKWKRLANGEPRRLIKSGKLFGRIHKRVFVEGDTPTAEVFVRDPEPYMFAQHFGAVTHPTVSEQSRKFFWAMFHSTGDEKWKWMALSRKKKFTVVIPESPFMIMQDEDRQKIMELLVKNMFIIQEVERASKR